MANKMELTEFEFPDEAEEKAKTQAEEKKAAVSEEEFDLEVVDDTPPQDRGRKPMSDPPEDVTDDELKSYDEKVQKRLKKFTKGYHDERRAKEEALRERQAAEEFAKKLYEENLALQKQLAEGSKIFIEQGKSSAQLELEQAKKKYKDAYENGDVDAVAEAQAEIAQATLKLDKAQNLRPIEVQEKPEYSPPKSTTSKGDQKLNQWMEENPWYGDETTPEHTIMSATALGVHTALVKQYGQGYVGTDEYYEKINARMRQSFPDYFRSQEVQDDPEDEPQQQAAPRAKPTTVVAPASRSTSPKKVKLSASQVAIAKRLGVPLELYAKKVAEQQENR